jgi:hypothetical protein
MGRSSWEFAEIRDPIGSAALYAVCCMLYAVCCMLYLTPNLGQLITPQTTTDGESGNSWNNGKASLCSVPAPELIMLVLQPLSRSHQNQNPPNPTLELSHFWDSINTVNPLESS